MRRSVKLFKFPPNFTKKKLSLYWRILDSSVILDVSKYSNNTYIITV